MITQAHDLSEPVSHDSFRKQLDNDMHAITIANRKRKDQQKEEKQNRELAYLKKRALLNDRKFQAAYKPPWVPPVPELPFAKLIDASPSENFVKIPITNGIYSSKNLKPPHSDSRNFRSLLCGGGFFSYVPPMLERSSLADRKFRADLPWAPVTPGDFLARPEFDQLGPCRVSPELMGKIPVPTRSLDDSKPNFLVGRSSGQGKRTVRAKSSATDAQIVAGVFDRFRRVGARLHAEFAKKNPHACTP